MFALESEDHVLLDCPAYAALREKLFSRIRNLTGDAYQIAGEVNQREWMLEMLISEGVKDKQHNSIIVELLADFSIKQCGFAASSMKR